MRKSFTALGLAALLGCAPTLRFRPIDPAEPIALLPCPYHTSQVGDGLDAADEAKRNPAIKSCDEIRQAWSGFAKARKLEGFRSIDSTARLFFDSNYQDAYYQAFAIGVGKKRDAKAESRSGLYRMELEDPRLATLLRARFGTRYVTLPIGNVTRLISHNSDRTRTISNEFLVGLYDLEGDSTLVIEALPTGNRKGRMEKVLQEWYGLTGSIAASGMANR